jgi:hypothetical protein
MAVVSVEGVEIREAIRRLTEAVSGYQDVDRQLGGEWTVPVKPSDVRILLEYVESLAAIVDELDFAAAAAAIVEEGGLS